jgi:hypothetical protein
LGRAARRDCLRDGRTDLNPAAKVQKQEPARKHRRFRDRALQDARHASVARCAPSISGKRLSRAISQKDCRTPQPGHRRTQHVPTVRCMVSH